MQAIAPVPVLQDGQAMGGAAGRGSEPGGEDTNPMGRGGST